ncbi:uncharacterized protein N7498_000300 [Penicillium cinerascens]|uniref:aldehyde dehydrogenase (NAD(+)) n=1 Tax=Penicillium cinerascens TaxID=70096 RepID=A0A9W9NE52_9EURO|nr:uncharacterized protein N7498_000300 [Penicillium cinerascens]KAJ5218201.1 hypothetical protein N7498_000300 [Penicillium cinerascens]
MAGMFLGSDPTLLQTFYEPLGVCVTITPFSFPFMTPLWSIPYALITGNTVVLKPSEKAPSVSCLMSEAVLRAGLPPGVFNLVHGGHSVVQMLILQPMVQAVSFVGSESAAKQVHDISRKAGKRIQAECGGKNHGVILDDASMMPTLFAIAGSAFGAAGQRCMSLSVVVFVGETREWIPKLVEIAQSMIVGYSGDEETKVGPLIDRFAKEKVTGFIDRAAEEGATLLCDGRDALVPGYPDGNFVGPTIITDVETYMECYQSEIYGPVLICMQVDTLDEAIDLINQNKYGNGCSLFTTSGKHAKTFQRGVNVGQIGINIPLIAPYGTALHNRSSHLSTRLAKMTETHLLWMAGEELPGQGELIPVQDPATGETFALCHAAAAVDISQAVGAGHSAFLSGVWSRASRHHRADVLDKCATLLADALPQLISLETRQTGRVIREMNAQVPSLVKCGKLHNFVDRRPLGVVVQITPFNHPLLIAVKKLAPALAAGNSVIIKPSELTPLSTLLLAKILHQAGLPKGVLSVLPGYGATTGKTLVSHPLVRKVDVTGGTGAGKAIGSIVGGNLAKYTAELGGKAPLVVFEKANIDAAVNGVAFGSFIASGQTCVASTRIIVQNSIMSQVVEKLKIKVQGIASRIGAPTNTDSMMGSLISEKQLRNVERLVNGALASGNAINIFGATRMTGKSPLDGFDFDRGSFYYPTVLLSKEGQSVLNDPIWYEEVFGPVIVVVGFDIEEEAINLANRSEFGLGAGIWTQDLSQAFRVSEQIDAGIVWVNTHHRNDPSSPWGGSKSASGVGSENGIDAYHAYTTTKSTIINFATAEESLETEDWFASASTNVRYG